MYSIPKPIEAPISFALDKLGMTADQVQVRFYKAIRAVCGFSCKAEKAIGQNHKHCSTPAVIPDDGVCIQWFEKIRWNGTFACNKCGEIKRIFSPDTTANIVGSILLLHPALCLMQRIHRCMNWTIAIYSNLTARKGVRPCCRPKS